MFGTGSGMAPTTMPGPGDALSMQTLLGAAASIKQGRLADIRQCWKFVKQTLPFAGSWRRVKAAAKAVAC